MCIYEGTERVAQDSNQMSRWDSHAVSELVSKMMATGTVSFGGAERDHRLSPSKLNSRWPNEENMSDCQPT